VRDAYDEGEIIEQKKTAVLPADTVDDIENKVRQLEMEWFPVIIESVILSKTRL
jgi:phosphoribosylglycinamide formyltransferase-1